MALPRFICVGAQKAGTTWLFEMLSQNPSVWLPPLKEVHFFDIATPTEQSKQNKRDKILKMAQRAERKGKSKGSLGKDGSAFLRSLAGDDIMTEAWYRKLFSHPDSEGKISGEITPAYLILDDEKLAYMKSVLPDTRIIILLREPKARNISEMKMVMARAKIAEPTEQDWKDVLRAVKKRNRGNYAEAIPRWQKHYGADQLLVLPFSMLKNEPAAMMQQIESFIGATPHQYKALNEQVHKTKEVTVPDWMIERAAKLAAPQQAYLIETFGQEFYEKTK